VLEATSLADVASDDLPDSVKALSGDPDNWVSLGRIRGAGVR